MNTDTQPIPETNPQLIAGVSCHGDASGCHGDASGATPPAGLGAVKGIRCAGVSAGFRKNPQRKDLALITAPAGSVAAGVFTQNRFSAAPVQVSRQHLALMQTGGPDAQNPDFRALLINSANANAVTGLVGLATAQVSCRITADALGVRPEQVLVASTGVIGVPLEQETFIQGVPLAIAALGRADGTDTQAGLAAAEAIMTTDTRPKQAAQRFSATQSDGTEVTYTVGGMAKGSGMIQPDMATLIAVLATDALLTTEAVQQALTEAMAVSFNKVTIDTDTSTNDSAFLIATGATRGKTINPTCPLYEPFVEALSAVCQDLAYQIVKDGEGVTKVITVELSGAASAHDADAAARAVANSPLVKTAIAGRDANWGRIAMALGKSGVSFSPQDVNIRIAGLVVCEDGLPVNFDEAEMLNRLEDFEEIVIAIDLGAGDFVTRIWGCDLTHGYITINGDYRT
ncbi:MAG: bifunctional glutamate N-acetyltransferase/amino-acid acetyltransferase ArgJ [Coriobacteriales bacterium]|jgi:glutamate N-acetyltransferase/amino-acid N-acetyltransferase|nr:bifunctional glutamate N-acetyltransferase/amino-acid acetyltransferase ArgJ [Coriobacteriales bacterium]